MKADSEAACRLAHRLTVLHISLYIHILAQTVAKHGAQEHIDLPPSEEKLMTL